MSPEVGESLKDSRLFLQWAPCQLAYYALAILSMLGVENRILWYKYYFIMRYMLCSWKNKMHIPKILN